jgi:GT2 family glycosyltransferase
VNVYVIILNHREADQTLRLLDALGRVKHKPLQVLVVDNASGAGDLVRLRQRAEVIESGGNLGYAGGNNVGIREAVSRGADAVWILNPDVEPSRRSLGRLVKTLESDERIGVLGCRILEGEGDYPTVQSEGGNIVWEAGGRSQLIRRGTRLGRRRRKAEVADVDFVPGAAMLVRSEVFEQVGLLPEHYFMYFEETEFCIQVVRAGWRVAVDPNAEVTHYSGRRIGLPSETFLYYFVRNRLLFGREHTGMPFEDLVADVEQWVASWRSRVAQVDEEWLPRFESLISRAVADARSGIYGKVDLGS